MLVTFTMMTFSVAAWYSHTKPVAPLGSWVVPPPATPVASGSVVPSADPTVAPVGHEADAATTVGVAAAAGGVGVDVAAPVVGDGLELPQAVRVAAKTNAVSAIQRELLSVTCNASLSDLADTRGPTGAL